MDPMDTPEPWDIVAEGYAAADLPVLTSFAEDASRLAAVGPGTRVLDVATGPGTLAFVVEALGASVIAVDFSRGMIRYLRERTHRNGVGRIGSLVADGTDLPFHDASFDRVFSMFGVSIFPNRARGLGEMRRVLAPGGRALVSAWHPFEHNPHFSEMLGAVRAAAPELGVMDGTLALGHPVEMKVEMEAAGFRSVDARAVERYTDYASTRDFWSTTFRTSAPLAVVRAMLGEDRWAEVSAEVDRRLQVRFGEGPQRVGMTAILGVGTA
jgi:SAM-dependent methyltransferase